jgi:hypothetical protein
MDYRDVVVALTELTPDARSRALDQLRSAKDEELLSLANFLASLLSRGSGRTMAVLAIGALVALWREEVELDISRGATPGTKVWPAIKAVRQKCLPILFELRLTWFGWNEWDDCLIVAPLAAVAHDDWYTASVDLLTVLANRGTPASGEARDILERWYGAHDAQTSIAV